MCRRRGRIRSGAIRIPIEELVAAENAACGRQELARRKGWRGEFQYFRARRNVEHDAAPIAVKAGKDGTQIVLCGCAPELHRQAAERAVGVGRVDIHAPEHELTWLIKGKRRASCQCS